MTELRRLLDDHPNSELSRVLESARRDEPGQAEIRRAARALGVSAAVGLGVVKTATAASVASKAATTGGASSSLLLAIAKWFGAGLLLGGVVVSPLVVKSAPPENRATNSIAVSPRVETKTTTALAPTAIEREPEPASEPAPAMPSARMPRVSAPETAPAPVPGPSVKSFDRPQSSPLDAETALLDTARRALQSGDAAGALSTLERYQQSSGAHALGAEAELLRVRALVAANRVAEAQAIAERALTTRAHDAYACRLANLAGLPAADCPQR